MLGDQDLQQKRDGASGDGGRGRAAHEGKVFHSNLAIKSRFMLPQNGEIDVISVF